MVPPDRQAVLGLVYEIGETSDTRRVDSATAALIYHIDTLYKQLEDREELARMLYSDLQDEQQRKIGSAKELMAQGVEDLARHLQIVSYQRTTVGPTASKFLEEVAEQAHDYARRIRED